MCIYNSEDVLVTVYTYEEEEVSSNPAVWIMAAFGHLLMVYIL